jgi:hypothetical protein
VRMNGGEEELGEAHQSRGHLRPTSASHSGCCEPYLGGRARAGGARG